MTTFIIIRQDSSAPSLSDKRPRAIRALSKSPAFSQKARLCVMIVCQDGSNPYVSEARHKNYFLYIRWYIYIVTALSLVLCMFSWSCAFGYMNATNTTCHLNSPSFSPVFSFSSRLPLQTQRQSSSVNAKGPRDPVPTEPAPNLLQIKAKTLSSRPQEVL
jgi:hypothetical protein